MKHSLLKFILIISFLILLPAAVQSGTEEEKLRINLRPYYKEVTVDEAQELLNVIVREKKYNQGFIGHSTISHEYEATTIMGDKIVIDHATGLMWHQNGSVKNMSWKSGKKWVRGLNEKGYAGFSDWRLPTLEEAVSLLEPVKRNGDLFIDPVFDQTQWSIWTCDGNISTNSLSLDSAWSVNFNHGLVGKNKIMIDRRKVRPVRVHLDD